jgi:CRISPR/Cas system CMR-associated protein Cmr5 small subunit
MKNLAQLRAASAIGATIKKGQGDGNVLSGFPMLVRTDGLLAALAFAVEKKDEGKLKHEGEHSIAVAITAHLRTMKILDSANPDALLRALSQGDATLLRHATSETLAFLSYLKRLGRVTP